MHILQFSLPKALVDKAIDKVVSRLEIRNNSITTTDYEVYTEIKINKDIDFNFMALVFYYLGKMAEKRSQEFY